MKRIETFVLALVALAATALFACEPTRTVDDPVNTDPIGTVELALSFDMQDTMTACGEAAGIHVVIENGNGETLTCNSPWSLPLVSDAYTTESDEGIHHVADCFFVVEPGEWTVTELEVIGNEGQILACCTEEYAAELTVTEGLTSEFAAELSCDLTGPGAIDIYGWLNRPPIIKALNYCPSKFTYPCIPVFFGALAVDREDDHIRYIWDVVSSPSPHYALFGKRGWASFVTMVPGTYQLRLTVMDEHGLFTDLTFPVHVVGWTPVGPQANNADRACTDEEPVPPPEFVLPAE